MKSNQQLFSKSLGRSNFSRFSNFSATDQATLNAKTAQKQALIDEQELANRNAIAAQAKVDQNNSRREGTLIGTLPYCTAHSEICNSDRRRAEQTLNLYNSILGKNAPQITVLNAEIKLLLDAQAAEVKKAQGEANLTPEQRAELARKAALVQASKDKLAADIALAAKKASASSRNKTIIVIGSALVAIIGIIGFFIYKNRQKNQA